MDSNEMECIEDGMTWGCPNDGHDDCSNMTKKLAHLVQTIEKRKDEAYSERNQCVALLSKLLPAWLEQHPEGEDWEPAWATIVFMMLPNGSQISWHLHESELHMFTHLEHRTGHSWDGHSTPEKYARMLACPDQQGELPLAQNDPQYLPPDANDLFRVSHQMNEKPCPFCGIGQPFPSARYNKSSGIFGYILTCDNHSSWCGVDVRGSAYTRKEALEEALNKWNKRPELPKKFKDGWTDSDGNTLGMTGPEGAQLLKEQQEQNGGAS